MRRKIRISVSLIIALVVITIPIFFINTQAVEFVGSSNSKVYHNAGCPWVDDIPSDAIVEFKSFREAERQRFYPCRTCKPKPYIEERKSNLQIIE